MLVEMTMNIDMMLPIMVCILVSKAVGDKFGVSLFDAYMEIKHFPFLERDIPAEFKRMLAKNIMSPTLVSLTMKETAVRVRSVLESTEHNAFPVLANNYTKPNNLKGLIMRKDLQNLLNSASLGTGKELLESKSDDRFQNSADSHLEISMDSAIDMFPFTVPGDMPLVRVYGLFRELGLRHLCVMDSENRALGMITRKDLYNHINHSAIYVGKSRSPSIYVMSSI